MKNIDNMHAENEFILFEEVKEENESGLSIESNDGLVKGKVISVGSMAFLNVGEGDIILVSNDRAKIIQDNGNSKVMVVGSEDVMLSNSENHEKEEYEITLDEDDTEEHNDSDNKE